MDYKSTIGVTVLTMILLQMWLMPLIPKNEILKKVYLPHYSKCNITENVKITCYYKHEINDE